MSQENAESAAEVGLQPLPKKPVGRFPRFIGLLFYGVGWFSWTGSSIIVIGVTFRPDRVLEVIRANQPEARLVDIWCDAALYALVGAGLVWVGMRIRGR